MSRRRVVWILVIATGLLAALTWTAGLLAVVWHGDRTLEGQVALYVMGTTLVLALATGGAAMTVGSEP